MPVLPRNNGVNSHVLIAVNYTLTLADCRGIGCPIVYQQYSHQYGVEHYVIDRCGFAGVFYVRDGEL